MCPKFAHHPCRRQIVARVQGTQVPVIAIRTEVGGHVAEYPSRDRVILGWRVLQRLAEGALAGTEGGQPLWFHGSHPWGTRGRRSVGKTAGMFQSGGRKERCKAAVTSCQLTSRKGNVSEVDKFDSFNQGVPVQTHRACRVCWSRRSPGRPRSEAPPFAAPSRGVGTQAPRYWCT